MMTKEQMDSDDMDISKHLETLKTTKEEVKHWLGNSHEDWIEDLMFKLMNNKISIKEIREEAKLMYKDHLLDRKEAIYMSKENKLIINK